MNEKLLLSYFLISFLIQNNFNINLISTIKDIAINIFSNIIMKPTRTVWNWKNPLGKIIIFGISTITTVGSTLWWLQKKPKKKIAEVGKKIIQNSENNQVKENLKALEESKVVKKRKKNKDRKNKYSQLSKDDKELLSSLK